jgi:hypothetical protein
MLYNPLSFGQTVLLASEEVGQKALGIGVWSGYVPNL